MGYAASLVHLAGAVGFALGGYICDKYFRHNMRLLIVGAAALCGSLNLLGATASSGDVAVTCFATAFLVSGFAVTSVLTLPLILVPKHAVGSALGIVNTAGQAAGFVAPLFMGSNPARVPSGPKAGLRLLAAEEDLARDLIRMLPEARRTRAMLAVDAFPDIITRNDPKVRSLNIEGLAAADMSPAEQTQLRKLLHVYSDRMTESAAREQIERIERAGFGKLHFGWAGSLEPGKPHYYRVHGPTVLIEYDNTQNDANHIHSVWRDLERDFGGDLLRAHYEAHQDDARCGLRCLAARAPRSTSRHGARADRRRACRGENRSGRRSRARARLQACRVARR